MNSILIMTIISIGLVFIVVILGLSLGYSEPTDVYLDCPAGLCRTNIYTGEKVCPESPTGRIPYNVTNEVCLDRQSCSGIVPCNYNSLTDGTICPGDPGYTGTCSEEICRCNSRIYCPDFVSAYLVQNLIPSADGDFDIYLQSNTWIDPSTLPRSDLPLSPGPFGGLEVRFCGVNQTNLLKVWPYGQCIAGSLGFNEADGLWYCMNSPIVCGNGPGNGQYVFRSPTGEYRCEWLIPDPLYP